MSSRDELFAKTITWLVGEVSVRMAMIEARVKDVESRCGLAPLERPDSGGILTPEGAARFASLREEIEIRAQAINDQLIRSWDQKLSELPEVEPMTEKLIAELRKLEEQERR